MSERHLHMIILKDSLGTHGNTVKAGKNKGKPKLSSIINHSFKLGASIYLTMINANNFCKVLMQMGLTKYVLCYPAKQL